MPAFKKFGQGDQVDNVLILEPSYVLVSGSAGWRGSPDGGSGSLSLYGGARRSSAHVVQSIEYQSLYPGANQRPRPRIGLPATASLNVVWMTNESLGISQRNSQRWGREHWSTVMRLYQDYYYRNPDYVTASYDNYCLYFYKDSTNVLSLTGTLVQPTGSFTFEGWVKPFHAARDRRAFTIQSQNGSYWLGMTGSAGQLVFSASNGTYLTSSLAMNIASWNHVAVSYDASTYRGTMYINLTNVGTFGMTPLTASAVTTLRTIGNQLAGGGISTETGATVAASNMSFHGLVGESRQWSSARSYAQLSSSWNSRLTGSALTASNLVSCVSLNDGPLSRIYSYAMGSGALDQARYAQGAQYQFGRLLGFDDRSGPVWQPNDNVNFFVPKQVAPSYVGANSSVNPASLLRGDDLARMVVIDVPSAFYGRTIVPGTVCVVDRSYSSNSYGLVRTLVDDGRGNLYLSGSVVSSSQTPQYVGFPRTQTDANNAIGYGNWGYAYLLDDLGQSQPVAPTWGGFVLSTSLPGPIVNVASPFGEGSRAMRLGDIGIDGIQSARSLNPAATTTFQPGNTDFAIAWVGRFGGLYGAYNGTTAIDFNRLFVKSTFGAGGGFIQLGHYGPHYALDGIRWEGGDDLTHGFVCDNGLGGAVPNEWHVGICVLDRTRQVARVGLKSLSSGREFISPESSIALMGFLSNSAGFVVGSDSNANLDIAGFMVASGTNSATGLSANMQTALENFASYAMTRRTFDNSTVGWNKVGNVFYGEGLITIKDPSLFDVGRTDGSPAAATDTLQLSFRGQSRVPVKTLMCRVDRGDFNATTNPTFWTTDSDGNHVRRHVSGSVYATTVGIYNAERELVGVARLADPVRIRERDRLNIRLRMDF